MLLFGAGSSVPFKIPDMKKFTHDFKANLDDPVLSEFLGQIESALRNSERLIGTSITFDLESLMVVLQDLASAERKVISAPIFALLLHLIIRKSLTVGEYNVENASSKCNFLFATS